MQQMTICDTTSGKTITLDCTRVLRTIKGRRTVYEGLFDGKPVIIKCFTSALHGKRHFKKEIDGLKKLTLRKIKTAQILAAGKNETGHYVLVLEKINNAIDVFSFLESTDDSKNTQPIFQAVFACVAQMHTAGVLQRDLHTGNFLWDGETIYALDPAEMKFSKNPLEKMTSFQQLAVLLASLPTAFWPNKTELLKTYFQSRQWQAEPSAMGVIEELEEQQRNSLIRRILRKTLRTSKRYIKAKHGPYCGIFLRELFSGQNPVDFIETVDKLMAAGVILKNGNTSFVSRIQLNGHDVVVKRYNHKGFWHSLRHTLKGSRAKKCWLFGHRLKEFNIATAKPVGFLEQRKLGLVWQSYILNEFIDGQNIQESLNRSDTPDDIKKEISRKTQDMLDNLAHFKMTHGDLKSSNILIHKNTPVLIDLDSMKLHRNRFLLRLYQQKMNNNIKERTIPFKDSKFPRAKL